jgi:hypothetical protein
MRGGLHTRTPPRLARRALRTLALVLALVPPTALDSSAPAPLTAWLHGMDRAQAAAQAAAAAQRALGVVEGIRGALATAASPEAAAAAVSAVTAAAESLQQQQQQQPLPTSFSACLLTALLDTRYLQDRASGGVLLAAGGGQVGDAAPVLKVWY